MTLPDLIATLTNKRNDARDTTANRLLDIRDRCHLHASSLPATQQVIAQSYRDEERVRVLDEVLDLLAGVVAVPATLDLVIWWCPACRIRQDRCDEDACCLHCGATLIETTSHGAECLTSWLDENAPDPQEGPTIPEGWPPGFAPDKQYGEQSWSCTSPLDEEDFAGVRWVGGTGQYVARAIGWTRGDTPQAEEDARLLAWTLYRERPMYRRPTPDGQ